MLAGRTGSGKTRLLQALAAAGAQVLDLEALAAHRGSILGGLPGQPQPTQKAFDNRLWQSLRRLDDSRPVFVESESKKIGRLQVPDALISQMHAQGQVLRVEMPDAARVQLLLEDYGFFAQDVDGFCRLLDGLVALRGKDTVAGWQDQARAGDWGDVFGQMMLQHYDPLYTRSMDRHYASYAQARPVRLADGGPVALASTARAVLSDHALSPGTPMRESPALIESRAFGVRHIPMLRPLGWLARGWRDLLRCPLPGLLHGLALALFGGALLLLAHDQFWLLSGAFTGFLLVAPVLATGLYAVSRALEQGQRADLSVALAAWKPGRCKGAAWWSSACCWPWPAPAGC